MELVVLTIAVLVAAYLAFVIAFPKVIPNEIDERTQKSLDRIYKDSEQSFAEIPQESISNSLDEETLFIQSLFRLPIAKNLYPLIIKAGLKEQIDTLILAYAVLAFMFAVLVLQLSLSPLLLLLCPVLPYLLIRRHCRKKVLKRNAAFLNMFPDVLDMFVRSVKSGFPVASAFKIVAENMDAPVSTEFQKMVQELEIGQTMSAVLTRLSERIDEPDVNFFVILMKVQQETGGNLGEVVTNLSNIIRKRKQLRLKIKALTSEGKATSYILGALPVLVFAALYSVSEGYLDVLWTTNSGMIALGASIGLVVGCMALVNRMIAIDI